MQIIIPFIFGAIVGSFLNVCIFRIPKEESIAWPGSHCFSCKKPIAWYDNVPILSFLILKGHCRQCKAIISKQYLFIEIFSALLFVLFYSQFGFSAKGAIYLVISLALLVESAIDLEHQIIPDVITLPGIILGLCASVFLPGIHNETVWSYGLLQSVLGILVGGGFLYGSAIVVEFFLKKEAMGGGDIKLLGMLGAFLGWRGALWIIFVSSVLGSFVGVYLRIRKGQEQIPFGPYLAAAAVLYMFFGEKVIGWYLQTIGWM